MPVTLKDIARELGVSVVTVSKVLRNHTDIGPETRRRVWEKVRELNYRPNLAARALVTGRTMMMGLIVPDLVHPFFGEVAKGLSKVLRQRGYGLLISSSEENARLEQEEIEQMLARRVDCLIVASSQGSPDVLQTVQKQGTPVILLDRRLEGVQADFVGMDDVRAGELATEHLIQQGYRRIAHIRGPEISTALGRLQGYRRALEKHQLEPVDRYVVGGWGADDRAVEYGYRAMKRLLSLAEPPDAVFCYNDPTALGAMKAALEEGARIPQDVALIGCGNLPYAELLRVPLSSIDQNSLGIGQLAARLALRRVQRKGPAEPRSILLPPRLVARASSVRVAVAAHA